MTRSPQTVYAGFWIRLWAAIIDAVLITAVTMPILIGVYGLEYIDSGLIPLGLVDVLVSWVLPAVAVIVFWVYKSATPGKMAIRARIVDAKTGEQPTTGQYVGRYFAYFISLLPLCLGYLWIAFDDRKQSFHDKLSGTVVVREKRAGTQTVDLPARDSIEV